MTNRKMLIALCVLAIFGCGKRTQPAPSPEVRAFLRSHKESQGDHNSWNVIGGKRDELVKSGHLIHGREIPTVDDVPKLLAGLEDSAWDKREVDRELLGAQIRSVSGTNGPNVQELTEAIGSVGPRAIAAVPKLRELLTSELPGVPFAAACALSNVAPSTPGVFEDLKKIATERSGDANSKSYKSHSHDVRRVEAYKAISRIGGKEAVYVLIDALDDPFDPIHNNAPELIVDAFTAEIANDPELVDQAIDALIKTVKTDRIGRLNAMGQLRALCRISPIARSKDNKEDVLTLLADTFREEKDSGVRGNALIVLEQMGELEERDRERIYAALHASSSSRLQAAARKYRFAPQSPERVEQLIAEFRDAENPQLRRAAVIALGEIGPAASSALADLIAWDASANESLKSAKTYALARIDPEQHPVGVAAKEIADGLRHHLKAFQNNTQQFSMRLMQDMQLIGGLRAKADTALPFLEEVIKVSAVSGHLGEVLQIAAVRCLGDMGSRSPEVVRVLTKSLEAPAVKVRRESERALANSA